MSWVYKMGIGGVIDGIDGIERVNEAEEGGILIILIVNSLDRSGQGRYVPALPAYLVGTSAAAHDLRRQDAVRHGCIY